jgi:hypothetical protein
MFADDFVRQPIEGRTEEREQLEDAVAQLARARSPADGNFYPQSEGQSL